MLTSSLVTTGPFMCFATKLILDGYSLLKIGQPSECKGLNDIPPCPPPPRSPPTRSEPPTSERGIRSKLGSHCGTLIFISSFLSNTFFSLILSILHWSGNDHPMHSHELKHMFIHIQETTLHFYHRVPFSFEVRVSQMYLVLGDLLAVLGSLF